MAIAFLFVSCFVVVLRALFFDTHCRFFVFVCFGEREKGERVREREREGRERERKE